MDERVGWLSVPSCTGIYHLSHVDLSVVLKVALNLVHPTEHPCPVLKNDNSTPVGFLARLSRRRLISYLSSLLQYQIMHYAPARHLPSPENHLFPSVMRLSVAAEEVLD